ncbi:ABC transporter substrate-binding protein [Roseomonas sp. OT10]|uniref:ABC transporter substrate-binding protein n=1 Tax=Roseomonas cutis TaxID=2897332 RepID=UPI001E48F383|nr:ABC transporter substrate-binding protein [Roseomonas sp. OT10]UFN47190.1 ABC transporter substrate-binding protein [Roseomonas sp. OT10]
MRRRTLLAAGAGAAALAGPFRPALAATAPLKVGLILPMTGPFASTGRQIEAAVKLYLQQNGSSVAGRAVEVLLKDDANVADTTRRLAQELVVNEKVAVLAGFGLTPLALAAAPIATRGKVPQVVMAAATSSITEASPFVVRTSQTVPQVSSPLGKWAAQDGMRRVVTVVTDYGPGLDAEKWFKASFEEAGGQVPESLRVPLANPDFAPFLQRARDAAPDAVFVFVPSGPGAAFMKQFAERGLRAAGIKLIGLGDVVDDDILNGMGDPALGVITSQHYSAAHDSDENRRFVSEFKAANNGMRPNFMAVGGYDGMALVYKGVEKAGASADGAALVEAMKGMAWTSPRGPISIDPKTRDIIQNIYMRRVERRDGELWNIEFATFPAVRDPAKAG